MANNSYVKVVSWNINGCGNPVKQKKVLLYLKRRQADLALIQETHLRDDEAKKFKRDWVGQVYYSSFSSEKNGVLILVHKRLNLSMVGEFKDANGRIICLETIINGMQLTLSNIYAPKSKFSGTQTPTPKDRAVIHTLIEDNGLIDVWRLVNPWKREYSFYSHCHKSYSRIDFIFFIPKPDKFCH